MSSLINPYWKECFNGSNKGWMDLVAQLKYGGVSSYIFQHDVNLNMVFAEFSTAKDPKDKARIEFISDPIRAFMVKYRQLWLTNKRFNCLQPIKESFKSSGWLMTSFGVNKYDELCMHRAIYVDPIDGKTVKEHVRSDDNGLIVDHPLDVLLSLYLTLIPRCLVLEWRHVKAAKEDKGLFDEPLRFTQNQITLVMNWLGIGQIAFRPTNIASVPCIQFIALDSFLEDEDAADELATTTNPPPPTRASSPVPTITTKSTIAQTVTTSTQTDSEKTEATVTKETSEQQPLEPPQSPHQKNDNLCHVPHCTKFIWHVDCDRCEGHCGCFCGMCDKVFGHKKDPCTCVESGAQPMEDDERLIIPPPPPPLPPAKETEEDKEKTQKQICDDCMKVDCECDDPKAEHVTHKEAEKELPACPTCGDPTECEDCQKCSVCCKVYSKKAKCGAQTTSNHACKMRAVCHECGACRKHVDPSCDGCDRK